MEISDDNCIEFLEDYKKMKVLREMAKKMPGSNLEYILKTVDEIWDEEIQKLQPPKNKSFVTKF